MNKKEIYKRLKDLGIKDVRLDEEMKEHTSFKIGGPADVFVAPEDPEDIKAIIELCRQDNIPFLVMGRGSNLLVRDGGIRGVVIKLGERFKVMKVKGLRITAAAGVTLSSLVNEAANHGLGGLEFAHGIPGTVGGALFMNAGAYGGEIKDVVEEAEALDSDGNIITLGNRDMKLGYRHSIFQERPMVILKGTFILKKEPSHEIRERIRDYNRRRQKKQPLTYPSAGSVFKRPGGYYAGKLIQDAGLKGFRVGDAQVSELHCGFIINVGNATARDVLQLMDHIIHTVKEKFQVELSPEIRVVGEE